MKLIIASNNKNKIREIKQIFTDMFDELLSMSEAGIDMEIVEDGKTFMENALIKANEVMALTHADAVLADDSGLMVDALNGAPGVFSARFAGEGHDDNANNEKLLAIMKQVPEEKRTCRFATAAALVRKNKPTLTAMGYCQGRIMTEPKGENGFGYDPIFYTEKYDRSFAECSADEKNAISHRGNALKSIRTLLDSER